MGTIKDIFDLLKELKNSTKDKQILELLFPIKEKLITADKELVTIKKEHLNIQEKFNKEKFILQKEILELKELNTDLKFRIKHKAIEQIGIIKERPPK